MARLKIDLGFSLKRLDLVVKGLIDTRYLGGYSSVFKGTGLEFADYRKYYPGSDDSHLIDWKASKRVNELVVKEFVEERNLDVIFLVDVSSQMLTGSSKKLKAEYIAEFVSSFSRSVLAVGDSVGLVMFSDKIVKNIPADSGMKQFYSLTKNLTNVSNYGGYSNIDNAISFIFKSRGEGALVILVSDFIYGIKSDRNLKLASKKFDFISVIIRDPIDMDLPKGFGEVVVEDPYSGSTLLIDPNKVDREYIKDVRIHIGQIEKMIKKSGSDYLFLETNKPFIKDIIKFFKRREAQLR
ncbi:DUF58 domain-containing protein [Candidatus Pacearchaeota archaeon]|nr:DUF58 domain-containing protein [Candidatus Pacearchaeota archaeon]